MTEINIPDDPSNLSDLIHEVMNRRSYRNLSEMARATKIPYQTLWAWERGTRNQKRPPTVDTLRKFARDFGMPESVVFRAAGRAYSDPGALDGKALELLDGFKSLPDADQGRLLRIVSMYRSMTAAQRVIVEQMLRGITQGTS